MTITWTKTETRTVEERMRLTVMSDFDLIGGRDATRDDVIAAIEADEELRDDVVAHIAGRLETELVTHSAAVRTRLAVAESDRDAWRERAEKAEKERDEARADVERVKVDVRNLTIDLDEKENTIARLENHATESPADALPPMSDYYRAFSSQIVARFAADAEELRARRKLDEWERGATFRRTYAVMSGGVQRVEANDGQGNICMAPTHVELARKLGII